MMTRRAPLVSEILFWVRIFACVLATILLLALSGCGVLATSSVKGGRTELSRDVHAEPERTIVRIGPSEEAKR